MNGILLFITGALFGTLVVCFSGFVLIFARLAGKRGKDTASVSQSLEHSPQEGGFVEKENEKMKRQFENFLNYDGTPNGQSAIGDE